MIKKLILLLLVFTLFHLASEDTLAIYGPTLLPNNKFGIHIVEPSDVDAAAELVGDWGYLTVVIQDNDRNHEKWTKFFEKLRLLRLIPIVRIATHGEDGNIWAKPASEDIPNWVEFLDSLAWPTKNRYIVLFNEPNHAREWGGALAPDEYAAIAGEFADKLHAKNEHFFVLPAGFDVYADGISGTMDATQYWRLMERNSPGIFTKFDGWTSHSYPKNNFSGSPHDSGRYSIRSYQWELTYLNKEYGVRRELPVFITETGWSKQPKLTDSQIGAYFKIAYEQVWRENYVVAVTPFLLNYPVQPFLSFSWKKPDGSGFFAQYDIVKNLAKVLGQPLTVPYSRFGELLMRDREMKLVKSHRLTSLLYPMSN